MKFRSEFDDVDFCERNETEAYWRLLVWTRGSAVSFCAPKTRFHHTTSHERDTQYVSTYIMWRAPVCTCAFTAHAPRNARYARAPLHVPCTKVCVQRRQAVVALPVRCNGFGGLLVCTTFVGCLLWTVCKAWLFCCLLTGSAAFFTQCFSRTITVCTVFFLTPLTGLI